MFVHKEHTAFGHGQCDNRVVGQQVTMNRRAQTALGAMGQQTAIVQPRNQTQTAIFRRGIDQRNPQRQNKVGISLGPSDAGILMPVDDMRITTTRG